MNEQKPFIQIDEDEIPEVLTKDRLPVLKTMIANEPEPGEAEEPTLDFLENTINQIVDRRLNQLAEMIETHFNTLDADTALTPAAIGHELAAALRTGMSGQDQEETKVNAVQYPPSSDLHDDK